MSTDETREAAGRPWLPDGIGLDPHSLSLIDPEADIVHLRLRSGDAYPRTACDFGLGEWWTGKPTEVTCPACLRIAPHLPPADGGA